MLLPLDGLIVAHYVIGRNQTLCDPILSTVNAANVLTGSWLRIFRVSAPPHKVKARSNGTIAGQRNKID